MANTKSNGPAPTKPGSAPGTTAENTNMHKLNAMGKSPKVNLGGKKTPC